jgi:peroxiredoxin
VNRRLDGISRITKVYNRAVSILGRGFPFPDAKLQDDTGRPARLPAGETLFAFFKTTCPTTEMAWPYLERIRRLADGGGLQVLPVSQDDPAETASFHRRTGFSGTALYDPPPWNASRALGLASVPAFFLVGTDGRIRDAATGFQKQKMEEFAARAAEAAGRSFTGFYSPEEIVPDVRPG